MLRNDLYSLIHL